MSSNQTLEQDLLKELLYYEPETGIFTWRVTKSNRIKVGDVAGSSYKGLGYIYISIRGKHYLAHRLAFLYMTGEIPKEVDHVNNNRSDNSWSNLRSCNRSENSCNGSLPRHNTSGVKGVSWDKSRGKWSVVIEFKGKRDFIGRFDCIKDATTKARAAREKLHKGFTNHG